MSNLDDDFKARAKRVRQRSVRDAPMPASARADDDGAGLEAVATLLRPQLALLLGVVAMVAGRAFAMNSLMIEPSTEVLSWAEGGVVFLILVGLGLMFGKSDAISHGALVVGAALAFILEGYYIPVAPGLMGTLYSPEYVELVLLKGP